MANGSSRNSESGTGLESDRQDLVDGLPAERIAANLSLHLAAADGDYDTCLQLLKEEGADAWWEDESSLNWSALHFAANGGHTKVVKLLLRRGALWNAVDALGMTAAEVAWSYNDHKTYRAILEEGVRQTIIQNLLSRQDAGSTEKDDDAAQQVQTTASGSFKIVLKPHESAAEVSASNEKFLNSHLSYVRDEDGKQRCVDVDGGLVMAAWETDIMEKTAEMLCRDQKPGFSVLNIGFGLGIIDDIFQRYKPGRHVIVEAHPDAVAFARNSGWDQKPGVEIVHSKWEDAIAGLGDFDVVYWDTFAQEYSDLRQFFEEIPNLLSGPSARFSFFHGLAGTNSFLYDVFTRVSEVDLRDIGLTTDWDEIRPHTTEETWRGIRREYWTLDVHRIPLCRMNVL